MIMYTLLGREGPFQSVFVSFQMYPFLTMASGNSTYSTIYGRQWFFQPGDMSCPAKLCFKNLGLDAGNLIHFKDLYVGDEITPMDV